METLLGNAYADFTVIVVDHGHSAWSPPPDISPANLVVLRAGTDLWWSGATNAGIRRALDEGADAVMLLNADCRLEPAAAGQLFEMAERSNGVVAPVQRSLGSQAILSAGTIPFISLGFPTFKERVRTDRPMMSHTIIRGGRGVAIPRSTFEVVGLFAAAELPHYLADHDFYLRCQRAGIALQIADGLDVYVDEASTSTASRPSQLSWTEFKASLHDPRSHRNLVAVQSFFRRNYPIRALHGVGTMLYLARYALSWAIRRADRLIRN